MPTAPVAPRTQKLMRLQKAGHWAVLPIQGSSPPTSDFRQHYASLDSAAG
jgi:hypothetical protein